MMAIMRATDFEFRSRFWLFGLIFWAGFSCYAVDHVNAAVALLRAIFGPAVDLDSLQARHALQAIFGVAALLVAASALIRTWATAYLRTDIVHDAGIRTDAVVADGPYRHVRNPLYFASMLMTLGMGMLASRIGMIVLFAGMLVFQLRLIGYEEEELLRTRGEDYRAYRDAVPRLWPSLRARLGAGGIQARWTQALIGEAFFWGFSTAVTVFATTLRIRYFYIILAASLVFYVVALVAWKKRRTSGAK